MSRIVRPTSGQPLIVIAFVLLLWASLRGALWNSPFPAPVLSDIQLDRPVQMAEAATQSLERSVGAPDLENSLPRFAVFSIQPRPRFVRRSSKCGAAPCLFTWKADKDEVIKIPTSRDSLIGQQSPVSPSINSWTGGMGGHLREGPAAPAVTEFPTSLAERWSFDSWLYFRSGGRQNSGGVGPLPATYGASQSGAVLRYKLAPADWRDPKAYIRVTKALVAQGEGDIAAGLSARPIKGIPASLQAEMRLSRNMLGTEIRPAILAVTEFPAQALPLGANAEVYAQAGYVGGKFSTPFIDGQLRLDREIANFDLGTLRAGAGIWGGAQKGASRVDMGPSASIVLPLGEGTARLSLDYRRRMVGQADPPSGVALTLSTGF